MWRQGLYNYRSFVSAIAHQIHGSNKVNYYEKPILEEAYINRNLTQEEIDKRELQKMILAENMWINQHKQNGLPETIIK